MTALEGQALLDHGKSIARRYARRIGPAMAEELQAEAIARALGSPPPDGRLQPWLERIYRNLLVDLWRRGRGAALLMEVDDLEGLASEGSQGSPEDEAIRRERRRLVRAALNDLPKAARRALLSKYFCEQEDQAVATRLGVAAVTVRTRVHRALARLRARLGELRGCLPMLVGRMAGDLAGQLVAVGLAPALVVALLVASQGEPQAAPPAAAPRVSAGSPSRGLPVRPVLVEASAAKPTVKLPARAHAPKPSVAPSIASAAPSAPVEMQGAPRVVKEIASPEGLVVFADPEAPASPCMVEPPTQFLAQIEKMLEDQL